MSRIIEYIKRENLIISYGFIIFILAFFMMLMGCAKWSLINTHCIEKFMDEMNYKEVAYEEMCEQIDKVALKYDFPATALNRALNQNTFNEHFDAGEAEDNKAEFKTSIDSYISKQPADVQRELNVTRADVLKEATEIYSEYVNLKLLKVVDKLVDEQITNFWVVLAGAFGILVLAIYTYFKVTDRKIEILAGFFAAGIATVCTGMLLPHTNGIGVYNELLLRVTNSASGKFVIVGATVVLLVEVIISKIEKKEDTKPNRL